MKTCFVICPIGKEGSDIRKRSDKVFNYIITPAVSSCGYEPLRADKISETGMITTHVINQLIEAPLVVADLSGWNANVFYELAIRHVVRKPFVQLIQKGETLPFDIAGMRTIDIDFDVEVTELAKIDIQKQIKTIEGKPAKDIETPISFSIQLQSLKDSGQPQEKTMASILELVAEFRSEFHETIQKSREADELQKRILELRTVIDKQRDSFLADRKSAAEENLVLRHSSLALIAEKLGTTVADLEPNLKQFMHFLGEEELEINYKDRLTSTELRLLKALVKDFSPAPF